jgi:hypothetical protein
MMYSSSYDAKAQGIDGCYPDCENDLWLPVPPAPASAITITVCGVPLEVRYRQRIACNIWYDIYIEAVADDPNTTGNQLAQAMNCFGGNMKQLLDAVTDQILTLNPMGFPPIGPGAQCEDNWRVMNGSCWIMVDQTSHVPPVPSSENPVVDPADYNYSDWLQPCESVNCCLEAYRVCYDPNTNTRTITPVGSAIVTDPDCADDPTGECVPVCGEITR